MYVSSALYEDPVIRSCWGRMMVFWCKIIIAANTSHERREIVIVAPEC